MKTLLLLLLASLAAAADARAEVSAAREKAEGLRKEADAVELAAYQTVLSEMNLDPLVRPVLGPDPKTSERERAALVDNLNVSLTSLRNYLSGPERTAPQLRELLGPVLEHWDVYRSAPHVVAKEKKRATPIGR